MCIIETLANIFFRSVSKIIDEHAIEIVIEHKIDINVLYSYNSKSNSGNKIFNISSELNFKTIEASRIEHSVGGPV